MPSTYTTNGGIEKIATGEQSGSWGDTTNTNFDIIDRITNGVGTITLSGTSSNLQTTDGTLSDGQYKALVLGGSPSGTHTITVLPNDAQKIYFVQNDTSESVIFSQGSGSNVTIAAGKNDIIYCDGGGAAGAVVSLTVDLSGYLTSANNLSDLADAATALTNLGVTSTAAELNLLDGSAAGTIANSKGVIYGASGEVNATTLQIAGTSITSTAAELNILDGVTATTAELNYNDITTLGTSEASKTVTADANGTVKFGNNAVGTSTSLTSSSNATTLNCRSGNDFTHTLTENTTFTFSNAPSSGTDYTFSVKITQDASATGYTVTWPASVVWPYGNTPVLTDTASADDYFVFITTDGGTTFYGFPAGYNLG